jgi:AraC family transcriptional regulator, melibiose operon regulatory protein
MYDASKDFQTHGLLASYWDRPTNPLSTFHRHNEIELNLLTRGRVIQTIAGRLVRLPPKTLLVFWAGFSHRFVEWNAGEMWSLSVPLTEFLAWQLPRKSFAHRLLHGEALFEVDQTRWPHDLDLMRRWNNDLKKSPTPEKQDMVLLEVHARLRRLSVDFGHSQPVPKIEAEPQRITDMLHFIAQKYQENLSVADIAKSANTTPSYAMELFRKSCGMSIVQYVNDQRLAHARRILATTDAKILDVAMESGFGSESQFYNVFRRACNQTPREYSRANSDWASRPEDHKRRSNRRG